MVTWCIYILNKIVGSHNFSAQFIRIISHYNKICYNINALQQTACLVFNPTTVGNFAFPFNRRPVGRTSDALAVVRPDGVYLWDFFCFGIQFYILLSPCLCFFSLLYLDSYVLGDDAWIS